MTDNNVKIVLFTSKKFHDIICSECENDTTFKKEKNHLDISTDVSGSKFHYNNRINERSVLLWIIENQHKKY